MGATTLALGVGHVTIPAVEFPDIQAEPVVGETSVTFTQTTGGRTGAPLPRTISRPPFIKITAPTVWTTLSLTIHADGNHDYFMISPDGKTTEILNRTAPGRFCADLAYVPEKELLVIPSLYDNRVTAYRVE